MTFEEIRRAIETARPARLPEITAALWQAFGAGSISEAQAEAVSAMIEARASAGLVTGSHAPRAKVGSRPRSNESLERRRRWAAAGYLPPQVAMHFTHAETAALAVVAAEVVKRGDCRLAVEGIAALAGVGRSTVKRALRHARTLGLVGITARRIARYRNLPNVVRVLARGWSSWLDLRGKRPGRQGVQTAPGTNTLDSISQVFAGETGRKALGIAPSGAGLGISARGAPSGRGRFGGARAGSAA